MPNVLYSCMERRDQCDIVTSQKYVFHTQASIFLMRRIYRRGAVWSRYGYLFKGYLLSWCQIV